MKHGELREPRQLGDDDPEEVGHLGPAQQRGVAAPQSAEPGDDVAVSEVPVQQQDLHERPGATSVAVRAAGQRPERVVRRGERARGAGLGQRGRAGQRPGLAARTSR